jgi:hypothetical protein
MNKEYMLTLIRERIEQLEVIYRKYFDTENGPSKSYRGSACMRSRTKKDLGTLKLLEYLLMYCPDSMEIESEEITKAFDRLVEPRRLE